MPNVDADEEMQRSVFAAARKTSDVERAVAIVTPGRLIMPIPAPQPESMPGELIDPILRIVPDTMSQCITVIAYNNVIHQDAFTTKQVKEMIPFLGYLIGMVYLGHNVIVFEGHPSALELGCVGADLLIVDQEMLPHLHTDWISVACGAMHNARILVFGHDGTILPWTRGRRFNVRQRKNDGGGSTEWRTIGRFRRSSLLLDWRWFILRASAFASSARDW